MINFPAFLFAVLLLAVPLPAFALNLSPGPEHYAKAMEFYYRDPRPELAESMLIAFGRGRLLANAEKRMFVAAFISELVKKDQLDLEKLEQAARNQGRDGRITLAWSLHLAGRDDIGRLLEAGENLVIRQIKQSPARLQDWNPAWEGSVLGMYWGAFMASGSPYWIDRIIGTALATARKGGDNRAAASLYDYAPRHPLIAERLRKWLGKTAGPGREMLEIILKNCGNS